MINILQYPDTSNPHYIDPLYIGDNNSGFQKRIKDLKDGNYVALANTFSSSVDTIMENVSRFKYYLKNNSRSGNIAIYDIWYKPMIRGTVNSSGVITSATMITPGNEQFRQRTGASSYTASAEISAKFWKEGVAGVQTATSTASITISTDTDGYVTSASGSGGSGYGSAGNVVFEIQQAAADTYPATPTLLEAADTWDTDDEWTDAGNTVPTKNWPTTVAPNSAEIKYTQPATITRSQSGIKYVQSAGYVKWGLDVEYPPMSATQFKEYHAIVQAARGQAIPMFFNLIQSGNNLLWKNMNSNNSTNKLLLKDNLAINASLILLEGLASTDKLTQGDTIVGQNGDVNGEMNTIISTTNANVFGEAKVRIAYPVRTAQTAGNYWNTAPDYVIVTLNESEFEYSVGTDGLYNVSVRFELDEWK